jgi:hypothetical protein
MPEVAGPARVLIEIEGAAIVVVGAEGLVSTIGSPKRRWIGAKGKPSQQGGCDDSAQHALDRGEGVGHFETFRSRSCSGPIPDLSLANM